VGSGPDVATSAGAGEAEIGVRHLVVLAAAVTVATFLVRLTLPYYSDNKRRRSETVPVARMRRPVRARRRGLAEGLCRPPTRTDGTDGAVCVNPCW